MVSEAKLHAKNCCCQKNSQNLLKISIFIQYVLSVNFMNFVDNEIGFSVKFYVGIHILDIFFEPMDVTASK